MRKQEIFDYICSVPKSVYVNLRLFPLRQALKLPVLVSHRTKLAHIARGSVELAQTGFGVVKFGFGGTDGIQPVGAGKSFLELAEGAKLHFAGKANFARGCSLRCKGEMRFGTPFNANVNCSFSCHSRMTFGSDVLLGWQVAIRDSDNHTMVIDGIPRERDEAPVTVGDHVWLCSCSDLLKGVTIGSGSVVAMRSLVTRSFPEEKLLIGGAPAKILRTDCTWKD